MYFRQRLTRRLCTAVSVFSLLFMQWMVAGYACARGLDVTPAAAPSMSAHCAEAMGLGAAEHLDMAGDTGAGDLGAPTSPELSVCHAHCQVDHTSADQAETPTVPLLTAFAPTMAVAPPEFLPQVSAPSAHPAALLLRATAPPIAVRHCCFRI